MVRVAKRKEVTKTEDNLQEHIIVQLPILPNRIDAILAENNGEQTPTENNNEEKDTLTLEPTAYEPHSQYESEPAESMLLNKPFDLPEDRKQCCFWCCHPISHMKISLPIRYDASNDAYITTGCFCSYECASAYNFETHQGTDRMWEINSWLQTFAERMGLQTPIRPAPSRYTLQMFGGPMNIHEFRQVHKNNEKVVLCNIPPLINVMPQTESVNTSYLAPQIDVDRLQQAHEKLMIKKKNLIQTETKNTLDSKLKLTYTVGDN